MSDPEDESPRAPAHRARPRPRPEPEPAPAAEPASEPVVPVEQPPERPSRLQRWAESGALGSRRAGLVAVLAGAAAVVLAAVLVVVLVHRIGSSSSSAAPGDQLARLSYESRSQAFVAGATSDILAVTSYSYRTLQSDIDNGAAVTTGAYRKRYRAALSGPLGATARRLHRTQTFELSTAGIGRMSTDGRSADVLLFGTQGVRDDTTGGQTHDSLVTLDATIDRSGDTYLISGLEIGGNAGLPAGTTGLTDAAEAARSEVAAVLTMRRAHLTADHSAALDGSVDPLRAQLTAQAAAVRRAVTNGKYDLTGEVTALAVQSASGNTATLMVAATGDRTTASGASRVASDGRYVVTVVRVQGQWYVTTLDPVTVQ